MITPTSKEGRFRVPGATPSEVSWLLLEAQDPNDMIWIRGPFLQSEEDFGKIVVHGHTPGREPVVRANRIGIDTGAVFTDRLTALRLENGLRELLQVDA